MWHSCSIFVLRCDLVIVASTESYRTTHQSQPATARCDECRILYQACRHWFLCSSVLPELYIYLLPTSNDGPCYCSCFCSSPGPHPANSGASKMTTNVIQLPRNESSRPDTERDQCTYLRRNSEGEVLMPRRWRSNFVLPENAALIASLDGCCGGTYALWILASFTQSFVVRTLPTFQKTADWRITDTGVSH